MFHPDVENLPLSLFHLFVSFICFHLFNICFKTIVVEIDLKLFSNITAQSKSSGLFFLIALLMLKYIKVM